MVPRLKSDPPCFLGNYSLALLSRGCCVLMLGTPTYFLVKLMKTCHTKRGGGGAAHILIAINSFSPSFEELSLATTFPLRQSPLQFRMNQGSSVSFDLEFASYDSILHPFKRKVKVIFHLMNYTKRTNSIVDRCLVVFSPGWTTSLRLLTHSFNWDFLSLVFLVQSSRE